MAIRALNPSSAGQVMDKPMGPAKKINNPQILQKYAALQEKMAAKELAKQQDQVSEQKFVSRLAGQIQNSIQKRPVLRSLAKVSHPMAIKGEDDKAGVKRNETLGLIRKMAPLPKKGPILAEK